MKNKKDINTTDCVPHQSCDFIDLWQTREKPALQLFYVQHYMAFNFSIGNESIDFFRCN